MMTPRPINPEEGQEIPQEDARTPSSNVPLQDQRMSRRGALGKLLGFGALAGAASLGLAATPKNTQAQDLTEDQVLGKDTEEGKQAIENLKEAKQNRKEAKETLADQQGNSGLGGLLWNQALNASGEAIMNGLAPAIAKAAKDLGGMRFTISQYTAALEKEMRQMQTQVDSASELSPTAAEIEQELARLQDELEAAAQSCAKGWNGATDAIAALSIAYGLIGRLPARFHEMDIGGSLANLAVNITLAKQLIKKNMDIYFDDSERIDKIVDKTTKSGKRKLAVAAEKVKAKAADTPDAATHERRLARLQRQDADLEEQERLAAEQQAREEAEQERIERENAQRRAEITARLRDRYPTLSAEDLQTFVDREMNDNA